MTFSEIYEKATGKANTRCCPSCDSYGALDYADAEVLVCKICNYSIDTEDLQSSWQEKIENDEGFYE